MIPVMKDQAFRLLTLCGTFLFVAACATYQAAPLPEAETLASAPGPDLQQLKVRASELQHPLLGPLAIDLEDGISPDEAAVVAVLANPDLMALRDTHDEAAAQLVGAGLLPNPDFSGSLDHPYGSGSQGTVNAPTLGLSLDLSRLRGRAARVAAASASLDAVDLGIAWQEWQVAQSARLAVLRVAMLQRRISLLSEQLGSETETVNTLSGAVEEGDATISDLGIHQAAREGLLQQRTGLQREAAAARSRLLALLGLPPSSEIRARAPSDQLFSALPPSEELLKRAIHQRLDLRALELGYRAQEAAVREAISQQFPSISVGMTSAKNETALKFLGGFVSLGLPIFDRNQGEIAVQRATRSRLEHEYEARIASIRAETAGLLAQDRLLGSQLQQSREGIGRLAAIEKAESEGLRSGDVDRLRWQQLRSSLSELQQQELALLQARLELRVALETAIGGLRMTQEVEE